MEKIDIDAQSKPKAVVVLDSKEHKVVSVPISELVDFASMVDKLKGIDPSQVDIIVPQAVKIIGRLVPTIPEEKIGKLSFNTLIYLIDKLVDIVINPPQSTPDDPVQSKPPRNNK